MSLLRFLRVLLARRALIIATTVSCLAGALLLLLIVPRQWEAHARVMLNTLRPDPVSGLVVAGPDQQGYVATQTELITDYTVAGRAVAQLGWLTDPLLVSQYNHRPPSDRRDLQHWLAQRLMDHTKVKVLEGSNILDIGYSGRTPDEARLVVEALRRSYLEVSLAFRQDSAGRDAQWWEAQTDVAKSALDAAQKAESDFERANGVVMADPHTDLETARLRALSAQPLGQSASAPARTASPSSIQLAQLDARIADAAQTLGPNHPELQQLRAQRAALARLAAQDAAAARSSGGSSNTAGALDRALATQKARVLAQGDKLKTLEVLQSEVDLRRDQFLKASAKAAETQQAASEADIGLSPLGAAVAPQRPAFPKRGLVLFGALVLGLGLGVLTALLLELTWPRVRGQEDLFSAIGAPVLAVFPRIREPTPAPSRLLSSRTLKFVRARLTARP